MNAEAMSENNLNEMFLGWWTQEMFHVLDSLLIGLLGICPANGSFIPPHAGDCPYSPSPHQDRDPVPCFGISFS